MSGRRAGDPPAAGGPHVGPAERRETRAGRLRRIRELDPVADAQEIYRITVAFEFPWDVQRALELALLRTYSVPSISEILRESREFELRPQKRYDDTSLLMSELVEHGYDSGRGKEVLRLVNRNHARWDITNDEHRYVLSTFVFEPIEWIDRFGWRRLEPNERLAAFHFWRGVGLRMGIRDLPEDPQEFRRWRDAFERERFCYAQVNAEIAGHTVALVQSWFPAPLRGLVARGIESFVDRPMAQAFGFRRASAPLRALMTAMLRLRSGFVRLLPPRRRSRLGSWMPNRTYPDYPASPPIAGMSACPMSVNR